MGEQAEAQLYYSYMNRPVDPITPREARNQITVSCLVCRKGIRPVAGCVRQSLDQHFKIKHSKESDDG